MQALRGGMMAAVLASGGLAVAGELALSGEFRVHNKVFMDDETEPKHKQETEQTAHHRAFAFFHR